MAWIKQGSDTSAYPVVVTVNNKNFVQAMVHQTNNNDGNIDGRLILNGELGSSTDFATRQSVNGGSDTTRVSEDFVEIVDPTSRDYFSVNYICGIAGQEALVISFAGLTNTYGASTEPARMEVVGKYDDGGVITEVEVAEGGAGTTTADSNLSVIGTDGTEPTLDKELLYKVRQDNVGGWVEVGRTRLSTSGASITVSDLPDKRYYMTLTNCIDTGGTINGQVRVNGDTGNNYARRRSVAGGADVTDVSVGSHWSTTDAEASPFFNVEYFANVSNKEKLNITYHARQSTAGDANPPTRIEAANKWANTTDAINEISITDFGSGSYDVGSEMVVLAYDPNDTHATNFWEELATIDDTGVASTSTGTIPARKYLWIQMYVNPSTSAALQLQFNNDTGTNYARSYTANGGADTTSASLTIWGVSSTDANPKFLNLFIINNTTEEKLGISKLVTRGTAGEANTPDRFESAQKWDNVTAQITEIDFLVSAGTGTFNGVVWGAD